jgi:hypothetical protein
MYRCASQSYNTITWCRGRVRADVLEERVWNLVSYLLEEPTYLMTLLGSHVQRLQAVAAQRDRDRESYREQLTALDRESAQWERAYAADAISLERLKVLMADIEQRKASATERLKEIEETQIVDLGPARSFLKQLGGHPESILEKRQVLEALHLVVVYRDLDHIRLFFSLPATETYEAIEHAWTGDWKSIQWDNSLPTVASLVHEPTERR